MGGGAGLRGARKAAADPSLAAPQGPRPPGRLQRGPPSPAERMSRKGLPRGGARLLACSQSSSLWLPTQGTLVI